jgi:hypothetical protein
LLDDDRVIVRPVVDPLGYVVHRRDFGLPDVAPSSTMR